MKTALVLLLAGSVVYADPPGATLATPPAEQPTAPPAAPKPAAPKPAEPALPPGLEIVPPSPHARTEAWISTGVTAAIVGMCVLSVVEMREASNTANGYEGMPQHINEWHAAIDDNDRWFHATLAFGGLAVVSAAVTGILWGRTQPSYRATVTPNGAYVGYARSF